MLIFSSCAAVLRARESNTPSHVDSKARNAVGFGARSADMHALCMYLYHITL